MKKAIIFLTCILISGSSALAQLGISTDSAFTPHNSAMLDVSSKNKGMLIPRMTSTERDSISNPADGLMLFCSNCGINGSLTIFSNGAWRTFSTCITTAPTAGAHIPNNTSIVWNWSNVPDALGYKWSMSADYTEATDMGIATSKTETGLTCGTPYTRYIWAYNNCGISTRVMMTQSTLGSTSPPVAGVHVPDFSSVIWHWIAVTGADGYKWNTTDNYSEAVDVGTNTSYAESNLNCATAYTRYVWTYSSCGVSSPVILTASTLSAPVTPSAGTHIAACTSITWNWNIVPNATGYKWNTTNDFSTATDMVAATSKTEANLIYGTAYTRYVWAYNPCGHSAPVTLTKSTLPGPSAPASATHIPTQFTITWKWHAVVGEGDVDYKWNTTNNYSTAIDMAEDTSHTETGLSCNTSYTRYVWGYNECGPSNPVVLTQMTSACPVCGDPFTINHVASGGVAPVDKSVTYETVNNVPGEPTKCWIARNLGASNQATAVSDATEASAGWYWQFNRKQGYKFEGSTRTPNSTWITIISENNNWLAVNDPCALEFGNGWRIPTQTEWTNVDGAAGGNWTNWNGPFNSILKMHAAGNLAYSSGSLSYRGSSGYYYSSTTSPTITNGYLLFFTSSSCAISMCNKAQGNTIRCIKD
jgi:hypothetical protein